MSNMETVTPPRNKVNTPSMQKTKMDQHFDSDSDEIGQGGWDDDD